MENKKLKFFIKLFSFENFFTQYALYSQKRRNIAIDTTEILNQTAIYGAKIAESVTNIWNAAIKPVLGNYLDRVRGVDFTDIVNRSATTIGEVVKQASRFAIPLAKLLAGKVVDYVIKPGWSLAIAYPVLATAFALVFVVIPVFREYCAVNEGFTLKTPLIMIWMIITRPFRLAYRILTVITGGAEVEKQRLIAAKKENIET
ncbi:MAG: hypothetical protein LBD34_01470, partial [Puniceicoccales bacterium]|nr:hypothetical protein [Puniceicoccales bacterium]